MSSQDEPTGQQSSSDNKPPDKKPPPEPWGKTEVVRKSIDDIDKTKTRDAQREGQ